MTQQKTRMHERIREHIRQNDLSQKCIAVNMGISESRLSLMLAGKRKITVDDYMDLCKAMALDPCKFYASTSASSSN